MSAAVKSEIAAPGNKSLKKTGQCSGASSKRSRPASSETDVEAAPGKRLRANESSAAGEATVKEEEDLPKVNPVIAARAQLEKIKAFLRKLARNPCQRYPEHAVERQAVVSVINPGLYKGEPLGQKKTRKTSEKVQADPVLFVSDTPRNVPGRKLAASQNHRYKCFEDYLWCVGRMFYTSDNEHIKRLGATDRAVRSQMASDPSLHIQQLTTLGRISHPLRSFSVAERWAPCEIALFESAICVHGKSFSQISRIIKTKSTKEVIEFYYFWKKTSHYKIWKQHFE